MRRVAPLPGIGVAVPLSRVVVELIGVWATAHVRCDVGPVLSDVATDGLIGYGAKRKRDQQDSGGQGEYGFHGDYMGSRSGDYKAYALSHLARVLDGLTLCELVLRDFA